MKFFKTLFGIRPAPSYKICRYPTKNGYKFAAFHKEAGLWWAINKLGTCGVEENSILSRGPFFDTREEAGAAVNAHATNGGAETVWMA